jgi:molybdate transport system substrate-binding protein
VNHGGSSALREQILEGAPVDVFASANMANMDAIVDAGLADGTPAVFAYNSLQIAVPAGNPAGVTGVADFARDELLLGMCVEAAPCGAFAIDLFEAAGVHPSVDTTEPDVRALLNRIALGELDAGITYSTDVVAAGDAVEGIDIPDPVNPRAAYPITVVSGSPVADDAAGFVAFVLSEAGREKLAARGFLVP